MHVRVTGFFHWLSGAALLTLAVAPGAQSQSLRDQMIAKAKKNPTLVVAGSNADDLRDKLKGFKKLYPFITVKAVTANTADTINRSVTEAEAGRLTIDLAAVDDAGTELLAKRGLLKNYEYPHLANFAAGSQPPHGMYVDLVGNPRVQGVYNTDLVPPKTAPRDWEAMLDPKWKGMSMISRSSEEFPSRLAWLWRKNDKLDWERAFDFFEKLVKNQKPVIARGYSGGNQRVGAGEVGIFWFSSIGQAVKLALKGAPVGLIAFPKFPITYRAYGIYKDAPHPEAAWLLTDYLTSPEGQTEYTNVISAKLTLNKKATPGRLAKWMVEQGATVENGDLIDPSKAPEIFTEEVAKKSEDFYFKLLGIK